MKMMHNNETILKTKSNVGEAFLFIKETQATIDWVEICAHWHKHSLTDVYCARTFLDINWMPYLQK